MPSSHSKGQAYGNLESYAGFAVMSMPMLASYIMNKTGSERAPFAAAAALSALQVLVSGMVLTETLPAEKRKPFTGVVNPLDCMRLFTITPTLSLTCGMLVLQWLTEPKNVADVGTLLGINQAGDNVVPSPHHPLRYNLLDESPLDVLPSF